MRAASISLPALLGAILMTIVAVTDPEPNYIADAGKMVDSSVASETRIAAVEVPQVWTYAIPRFVADLEGDLSPVGDGSTNRLHDFPAWAPMPTPTPVPVVATARPLPAIASVPQHCPAVFTEVFGANAGAWCAVSKCESGWRLDAMNVSGLDDSHGPLQINFHGSLGPARLALIQSLGYPVATQDEAKRLMRTDWHASLRVAYVLSSGGVDFSPWSCRRVLN